MATSKTRSAKPAPKAAKAKSATPAKAAPKATKAKAAATAERSVAKGVTKGKVSVVIAARTTKVKAPAKRATARSA